MILDSGYNIKHCVELKEDFTREDLLLGIKELGKYLKKNGNPNKYGKVSFKASPDCYIKMTLSGMICLLPDFVTINTELNGLSFETYLC